jgi:multidrug resistance efflux pump
MMNLEDAMEKILELTDKNKELEDQIQSYEIKRQDYESKLESNASEISRLKELNMKYFTRLTVEKEETHVVESEPIQETEEALSYDDLLKDWR